MDRATQIRRVGQGFADLKEFAANSWSNLAIVDKVEALHEQVRLLYPPVIVEVPVKPVQVDENTRWG